MRLANPRAVAVVMATAIVASVSFAHAQSAEAEVLFRDGRKLIKSGKLAAGCDKLAASERLESSVGTLLNLGDCREKLGKLASAWSAFRKAAAMSKRAGNDSKREEEAMRRAVQLEPRLPNLVIQINQRIDGLVIKRDGEVVDPGLWNTPIPVDPDSYEIVAEAPGYVTWRTEVPIDAKLKRRIVSVPQLQRAPVAKVEAPVQPAEPTAPVPQPDQRGTPPASTATAEQSPGPWTPARQVAVGVAGAGVAALGVGVYFGLRSNSLEDQANDRCPTVLCADSEAVRLNDRAQTAATRANIFYAVGGVGVVAATVIWFVGKPDTETVVTPTVGSDRAGVSLQGSF